ncbi:hypothetical protein V5O48_000585 [Marasmius crinis-equi]|uniref:Peptidase S53 domain-containing protein n=1 Tax=Marasmius crinis-equi TaxID=585013 RepID=A0ABR3G1W7_9AGAR
MGLALRILLAAAGAVSLGNTVVGSATPHRRAMSVLEERPVPDGFARTGELKTGDNAINLKIALTPKDRDSLEKALYAVSTPGSASYGQHLSYQDVKAFMEPHPEAITAVTQWLSENNITDVKSTGAFGDWLSFTVPASQAGSLLSANFESFRQISTGQELVRTLQYSIPQDLRAHVTLVHPTTSFALRPPAEPRFIAPVGNVSARANPAPTSCNTNVTPNCLQTLYGIPTTPATQSSNKLGVTGFIDQWAQNADLKTFLSLLRPDVSSDTSFEVQSVDGGVNTQDASNAGIEANLDIQYTVGIATGVPVTFITVGDDNQDGVSGFLDVIDVLVAEDNPPAVLSTSYGFDESDLGPELAGVGSTSAGPSAAEESASDFSSGGFSDFFPRPSYQDSAVNGYLQALGTTNSGQFNSSNRAYPDISARGTPVQIVNGGQRILVQGTSCSTPIFASVIALINDRLVAAGKPVLGFLNPFLYAHPDALFDTTAGTNDGPNCGKLGFPAVSGWDASTGLGTPNFDALLGAAGL